MKSIRALAPILDKKHGLHGLPIFVNESILPKVSNIRFSKEAVEYYRRHQGVATVYDILHLGLDGKTSVKGYFISAEYVDGTCEEVIFSGKKSLRTWLENFYTA